MARQVIHVVWTQRVRDVDLWTVDRRRATKILAPPEITRDLVGVIKGMPGLVAEEFSHGRRGAALHGVHHQRLNFLEVIVGEVKRHGDRRNTARAEPFIAKVNLRAQVTQTGTREFLIKILDVALYRTAIARQVKFAEDVANPFAHQATQAEWQSREIGFGMALQGDPSP